MKTHLNDDNFQGEIVKIYDHFISKIVKQGQYLNK